MLLNQNPLESGMVDVSRLTIHPLLADAPRLPKKDPRYLAMKASWEETGIIPTILITPTGEIVDGRHRYWFAQESGEDTIHARVVDPALVPEIILGALSGRNHASKSQLAYLAAPALAAAFEQARERRSVILRSGGKAKLPPIDSPEELAIRLGVNETYLKQAQRIHDAFQNETKFDFNNPPAQAASLIFDTPEQIEEWASAGGRKKRTLTLRGYFEPRILDPEHPLGLGDVLKGIGYFLNGGAEKAAGTPPKRNSHLHVLESGWKTLAKAAPRWSKLSSEDRDEAVKAINKSFSRFPPELLGIIAIAARKAGRSNTDLGSPMAAESSVQANT